MLALCFKNYILGVLEFDFISKEFVYTSNVEQENIAEREHKISDIYHLFNSRNLRSEIIFSEFCDFLDATSRKDIVKKAGILVNDNLYTKLEKISNLNFDQSGFYLKKMNEVDT